MKSGWKEVTWYSKLLTAGLLAGLYVFGVYIGQQYAESVQPTPAIIYTAYQSKEVPVLMAPVIFTAATSSYTIAAKKIVSTPAANTAPKKNSVPAATPAPTPTSSPPVAVAPVAPAVPAPVIVPVIPPASTPASTPPAVTAPPPVPPPPAVTPPATSTTSTTTSNPPPPAQTSNEIRFTAYTTGYGWPDNTPPGAAVSNPVLHQTAGGTGTYADPITVAVGHSISGSTDTLDYPAGTIFYLPNLRRYFIVEDTCGDGNTPQNGPCHTGYQGHVWLDLWIGGQGSNNASVLTCEDTITGLFLMIQNPSPNYAVVPGPVYDNSCATQYGDTVVSS